MANSASESNLLADSLGVRHTNSSLFSIPGFFAGFGTKGSVDGDSLRSPTSPLDFKLLSNLGNPFSFKSSMSSSEGGHQKKFICHEVGLRIINSIVDDCEPTSDLLDSKGRKNVLFGPQVKTKISELSNHYVKSIGSSLKSNSLPSNYTISSLSIAKIPDSNSGCINSGSGNGELSALESEQNASSLSISGSVSSSAIDLTQNSDSTGEFFPLESRTIFPSITSSPQRGISLPIKSSSLPIAIVSSPTYVGSLTAKEIELSEDYTCIISHGPNPKTTHIFGDCILECHPDEAIDSTEIEKLEIESSPLSHDSADGNSLHCHSCEKSLNDGDDISFHSRDGKAFCSSECSSQEIFAEDKIDKTSKDESESSTMSSYHEDLFIMGLPFAL